MRYQKAAVSLFLTILLIFITLSTAYAAMTQTEKEEKYSTALSGLESYLENPGGQMYTIDNVIADFESLQNYSFSKAFVYYAKVLKSIEVGDYSWRNDEYLFSLQQNDKFNEYVKSLTSSPIYEAQALLAYYEGRKAETNGDTDTALAKYSECRGFYDVNDRRMNLVGSKYKGIYDEGAALMDQGKYAEAYLCFEQCSDYEDASEIMTFIVSQLGYTPGQCGDNHTWGAWQEIQAATDAVEGLQRRECSVCGKTEELAIERLPDVRNQLTSISTDITAFMFDSKDQSWSGEHRFAGQVAYRTEMTTDDYLQPTICIYSKSKLNFTVSCVVDGVVNKSEIAQEWWYKDSSNDEYFVSLGFSDLSVGEHEILWYINGYLIDSVQKVTVRDGYRDTIASKADLQRFVGSLPKIMSVEPGSNYVRLTFDRPFDDNCLLFSYNYYDKSDEMQGVHWINEQLTGKTELKLETADGWRGWSIDIVDCSPIKVKLSDQSFTDWYRSYSYHSWTYSKQYSAGFSLCDFDDSPTIYLEDGKIDGLNIYQKQANGTRKAEIKVDAQGKVKWAKKYDSNGTQLETVYNDDAVNAYQSYVDSNPLRWASGEKITN